jgi:hypothetical protein
VLLAQRRQHADHDEPRARVLGLHVGPRERLPQLRLELAGLVAGQRPGPHVQLQVVLAQLGRERGVVELLQHDAVGHRRLQPVVDEVQLDL